MKKLTRNEIEVLVFDTLDPTTSPGSWRSETLDNLHILSQAGVLSDEVIQVFRQAWQQQQNQM